MSQGIGLNPGGVHHHPGLPAVFAAIGSALGAWLGVAWLLALVA